MKKWLAPVLLCLVLLAGCAPPEAEDPAPPVVVGTSTRRTAVESDTLQFTPPADGATVATITTSKGDISVVLYPQHAPLAVQNFTTLAQNGYYSATAFHRVVKDFVIQGGDKDGTGLSGESIWGGPFATERSDKLHHYAGALCMAGADSQPDTHLSQFYIVACPQGNLDETALAALTAAGLRDEVVDAYRQAGGAPYLDNTDTVFGHVYAGMDVVDDIAAQPTDDDGRPTQPIEILSITVDTYAASGAASVPASSGAASGGSPSSSIPPLEP